MKKIFFTASVLLLAATAQASILYWQVQTSELSNDKVYGGNMEVVDYAKITYKPTNAAANQYQSYEPFGTIYNSELNAEATPKVPGGSVYVVEGEFSDDYTYYIELYNSSNVLVSRSAGSTGSQLSTGDYIYGSADFASMLDPASINVWHGGGSYSAVPEPTSAILMMFGMAFLGLKRKNRSIA